MKPRPPRRAGRCRAVVPLFILSSLVSAPAIAMEDDGVALPACSPDGLPATGAAWPSSSCDAHPVVVPYGMPRGFPPSASVAGNVSQAGEHAVAVGFAAQAAHKGDIAIGSNAIVTAQGGIAIGAGALADAAATVSFGNKTETRRLVHVSQGELSSTSDHAVTGAQLFSTNTNVSRLGDRVGVTEKDIAGNAKSIKALSDASSLISFDPTSNKLHIGADKKDAAVVLGGGSDPRVLDGVKKGNVFAGSKQAVNGEQLHDVQVMVDWNTDHVKLNQNAIAVNTQDIATINAALDSGGIGVVTVDEKKGAVLVGAGSAVQQVDIAGKGGARVLAGVKDGRLAPDSTQAVNGAQLLKVSNKADANGSRLTTVVKDIATINEALADTGVGLVTFDDAKGEVAVAAGRSGTAVNVAGADGARLVTGVKDGSVSVDSTQAVNGRQLFTVSEMARSNMGRIDQAEHDIVDINATLSSGDIGLVKFDAGTGTVKMGADTAGGQVSIAGTDGARRLRGLANGVADDDAVSLAQLRAAGAHDPGTGDLLMAVKYDDPALGRATLGGQGGTVLANVAAGMVGAGSRDAVNGGQLWDFKQDMQRQVDHLDDRVGGIEQAMADGQAPAPGQGDGGTGDLVVGADTAITIGAGAAASDKTGVAIGHESTATGAGSVAIGQGASADRDASVAVGAAGSERQIIHVADATAATDAVNLRQLDDRFQAAQAYTDARVQALDERLDRMGAMSAAYAGMALNTAGLGGDNRVGVGMGMQNGRSALSVGYQRILGPRRNISVSLGGAFSGNERGLSAGTGISW